MLIDDRLTELKDLLKSIKAKKNPQASKWRIERIERAIKGALLIKKRGQS